MTKDQLRALAILFEAVEAVLGNSECVDTLGKLYAANERCARLGNFGVVE